MDRGEYTAHRSVSFMPFLMVIDDFDIIDPTIVSDETNAPRIIDADRMLSGAITFERLKAFALKAIGCTL